mmetsp:Transcript_15794/g.15752  ORF Transcript_15794/g.15752 Transcript_15794/m.15752 type:complete len:92 (-) Transcript_15794:884-1159(-)
MICIMGNIVGLPSSLKVSNEFNSFSSLIQSNGIQPAHPYLYDGFSLISGFNPRSAFAALGKKKLNNNTIRLQPFRRFASVSSTISLGESRA